MKIFGTSTLPFDNAEIELGVTLNKNFLKPAVAWTLGLNGLILDSVPQTLVEMSSCWWAVALYVEIYLNAQSMPNTFSLIEREILGKQAIRLAKILLENQAGDGSWDKGSWDTSVICRSLLLLLILSQTYNTLQIEPETRSRIISAVKLSLEWLIEPAIHWESVRYSFGPEDLAMIVRLLCVVEESKLDLFPRIENKSDRNHPQNAVELINNIVNRLLQLKTMVEKEGSNIPVVYWDTSFSTAHVVQAFCESIEFLYSSVRNRVITRLAGAIIHIEETQDEGKWGMPNSTSLVLHSYVLACQTIDRQDLPDHFNMEPLATIVFKALRWLTDEKQRFSDGSILHTFTHTSFFILMLQHLSQSEFPLLNHTILQIYDYVVWDGQTRILEDRATRMKLTDEVIKLNGELKYYIRFYNFIITLTSLLAIIASLILTIKLMSSLQLVSIVYRPFAINLIQADAFFTGIGLYASGASILWFASKRLLKEIDEI